jgi:uncharacterized protein (DUF1800 family)
MSTSTYPGGWRARLRVAAFVAAMAPVVVAGQSMHAPAAESAVREQTADQQVMQVLNRLAFGPRPGDAARVRKMGVDQWIAQQLHPERIDDSAMEQLIARYRLLNTDQSELATQFVRTARELRQAKKQQPDSGRGVGNAGLDGLKAIRKQRGELVGEISSARVARAVASNRQLLEVMTDFWENHFNVYVRKNAVEAYYLADYDGVIRAHALGKFRDLLGAVAHSPAMLVYLDNAQSRANPGEPTLARRRAPEIGARAGAKAKNGLNENYGRELLELHTLGVDGGYTQQDVIEAARAFTGWSVRPPMRGSGFVFRPEWHDAASKTFMGHRLPAGRGEQDGEDILDIVARSPATARFIALRLAQRFVSDSPSAALIDRAAQTFTRSDGDIREVVRTIVTSPEFFGERAYHAKVKSPFEVVVSTARALDAQPDTTAGSAFAVTFLGEQIFGHQDPNGWPETGESWMNAGAILNRINFGMAVAAGQLPGAALRNLPGADSLEHASREVQVDAVVADMLGGAVSPDMRKILLSGENPLTKAVAQPGAIHRATAMDADNMDAATAYGGMRRNRLAGPPPQLFGFAQVVGLALGSPEFQRR